MIRKFKTFKLTLPSKKRLKIFRFLGANTAVAEENLPIDTSSKCYNFNLSKGVLEQGFGISQAKTAYSSGVNWKIDKTGINTEFLKLYKYSVHNTVGIREYLLAYGANGKLYYTYYNEPYTLFGEIGSYGEPLCAINFTYSGVDGLLLSTTQGLYFVSGNSVTSLYSGGIFTSLCIHDGRVFAVFATSVNKVHYTDDLDPSHWNTAFGTGGFIEFNDEFGNVVKLISRGASVLVFREFGICKITEMNDQTRFSVIKIYHTAGRFFADTISEGNGKIFFQAGDGVYAFDGNKTKRILEEIKGAFSNKQCEPKGCVCMGKYYLACNLDFGSNITDSVNSVVVYDCITEQANVAHDVSVKFLLGLNTPYISGVITETKAQSPYFGVIDNTGAINGTATTKVWQSALTSLGLNHCRKMLRDVIVRCEGNMTIKMKLDNIWYIFSASAGLNKWKVCRFFEKMQMSIIANTAQARVTSAEMCVDVYS